MKKKVFALALTPHPHPHTDYYDMAKTKTSEPATVAVPKKSGNGGRIEKSGAKAEKAKVTAKAVATAATTKPAKTTAVVVDKKKNVKSVLKNGDEKVCVH